MRGNNLTYIPSEMASAAKDGIVASAEAIKDYRENRSQEDINHEILEAKDQMDTEARNIKTYNDATIAAIQELKPSTDQEVLENAQRLNIHADALSKIAKQLNSQFNEQGGSSGIYTEGLKFAVVEEEEMQELIDTNTTDKDTIYFQLEPVN